MAKDDSTTRAGGKAPRKPRGAQADAGAKIVQAAEQGLAAAGHLAAEVAGVAGDAVEAAAGGLEHLAAGVQDVAGGAADAIGAGVRRIRGEGAPDEQTAAPAPATEAKAKAPAPARPKMRSAEPAPAQPHVSAVDAGPAEPEATEPPGYLRDLPAPAPSGEVY